MVIKFKQKCSICNKNYVPVFKRRRFVVCYECQKKDLEKEVKNKDLKKLLDIPHEYYKKNAFLRNIKISAIKYNNLTERQITAFKNTLEKMKKDEK